MTYKEKAMKMAIVNQNVEAADITVEDYVLMGRLPYRRKLQFFETEKDREIAEKFYETDECISSER